MLYLLEVNERIPLRKCLGYQFWGDMYILWIIISDTLQYFTYGIPWLNLALVTTKYISLLLLMFTWQFSKKQSIIDLLSEYYGRTSGKRINMPKLIMIAVSSSIFFVSLLYDCNGGSLLFGMTVSIIIDVMMGSYLFCQYYLLKKCGPILEMASAAMLENLSDL